MSPPPPLPPAFEAWLRASSELEGMRVELLRERRRRITATRVLRQVGLLACCVVALPCMMISSALHREGPDADDFWRGIHEHHQRLTLRLVGSDGRALEPLALAVSAAEGPALFRALLEHARARGWVIAETLRVRSEDGGLFGSERSLAGPVWDGRRPFLGDPGADWHGTLEALRALGRTVEVQADAVVLTRELRRAPRWLAALLLLVLMPVWIVVGLVDASVRAVARDLVGSVRGRPAPREVLSIAPDRVAWWVEDARGRREVIEIPLEGALGASAAPVLGWSDPVSLWEDAAWLVEASGDWRVLWRGGPEERAGVVDLVRHAQRRAHAAYRV